MRQCKQCGSTGPFYTRQRTLRDGSVRVETPRLCKECEKASQRARYHASKPKHMRVLEDNYADF